VFLAPQFTALRCPWVSALVVPVVRVPSCARGPPGVLITAHLHMYNKSVLKYCIGTKKRRPPRTAVEIPFNIKGLVSASTLIAKNQDESFDTNILKLEIYTLQM